jgi:hypothetical protein
VHYIFEVTVKDGYSVEAYAEGWIAASRFIQKAPVLAARAYIGKLTIQQRFLLLQHGILRPVEMLMEINPPEEIEAIINAQLPFVDIRFLGEFEAPDWVVLPPNYDGEGLSHFDQD